MYHLITRIVATIMVISVVTLTFIAILSIWDILDKDVVGKSISTLAILAFSSLIILLVMRVVDKQLNSRP